MRHHVSIPHKNPLSLSRGFLRSFGLPAFFHFRDVSSGAAAVRARCGIASVDNVVFGVQHNRDHLLSPKSQNPKVLAVARDSIF